MVWWHGIAGIAGIVCVAGMSRRCGGLWELLVTWSRGRTAVALERERNRATAEVVRLLPAGGELLEYERGGRLRLVRGPGPAAAGQAPATPGAGGEISR